MHQETKPHLDAMFIGLERARQDLYRRIDERVEQMFERGLVGEVANLLERGYGAEIDRIRPLGYPEVKAYLLGQIDLDRAKYLIQRNSRRYAKRQYTWFRSDPRIRWFLFGADEEPADHAMQVCRDVGIIQSQVAAAPRQAND
jgi:tRNA dimethylallyltransferase